MPVNDQAKGKTYPPYEYEVGKEKIKEYAWAVGETNPVHLDPEAARSAGHRDVVAPPMFAVVYSAQSIFPALFDPEIGLDFARMVHGGQEFTWGPLVVAGDEITTECEHTGVTERPGLRIFTFETRSSNQDGARVCTGTWTNIVREG